MDLNETFRRDKRSIKHGLPRVVIDDDDFGLKIANVAEFITKPDCIRHFYVVLLISHHIRLPVSTITSETKNRIVHAPCSKEGTSILFRSVVLSLYSRIRMWRLLNRSNWQLLRAWDDIWHQSKDLLV